MTAASFPPLLQAFFTQRLVQERCASGHTVAGYRDTFRLLLRFAANQLRTAPSDLMLDQIDAAFVSRFLEYLESDRGSTARTRNARLAGIRSFFRYVALTEPAYALQSQRVLAIPTKRQVRKTIAFLTQVEIEALLAAPDASTWIGRRDRTLLLVAAQTGLRASELTGLRCQDVVLGTGAHVRCEGRL